MASTRPDVVIVGAGIIGLTTGVRLAERGLRVRIRADRRGAETSSHAAGAIFDPLMSRHARRGEWAGATRREFGRMIAGRVPFVRLVNGVEASRTPLAPPAWALQLPGYRPCAPSELPSGFVTGWRYRAPIVDMPPYLRWLEQRFADAGGDIRAGRLETLDDGFADANIVINCAGIGARDLVPDGEMQPIRGQLVVIPNPDIHEFFVEHATGLDVGDTTYLLPQGEFLLLGGNAEKGEPEPVLDPKVAQAILQRCAEAFPKIIGVEPVGDRVGIRPQRTTIRLEHQDLGDRHIVHNYGHGGSGVSLSWGCADEVTSIVREFVGNS
jgi:D-amino-acid oxidase